MKLKKFHTLASILFVFSLSGCSIIFKGPNTGSSNNTGNTSTNTNTGTNTDTTVVEEQVTAIEVNPSVLALEVGESYTIGAQCLPENSNQKVTWKSSKANIATVDSETGLIKALTPGSTKIYATSVANARVTGYCSLTVANEIIYRM